jgi:ABC-type transporter Mla subunit MlaD
VSDEDIIFIEDDDNRDDRHILKTIERKVEQIMADITALQSAVDQLQTSVQAAATELSTLASDVAGLTPGSTITQDQIDALTASVTSAQSALDTAVSSAQSAVTPPPPPPPASQLFEFTAAGSPDLTNWALDTTDEAVDGTPLYTFIGSGPAPTDDPSWTLYTGATQPVPVPTPEPPAVS